LTCPYLYDENKNQEVLLMNIQIGIKAPELAEALGRLADELAWGNKLRELSINQAGSSEQKSKEVNSMGRKEVSLEEVRARLAGLSQSGHREEVRALIERYGAVKLTDVKPDCYLDLMKEAEKIDGKKE
jgi:hypothetical protein